MKTEKEVPAIHKTIHRPSRRRFLRLAAAAMFSAVGVSAYGYFGRWKYILIHHSAGSYGNVAFLKRVHRERQPGDPIDSMAYHFIIGNGNGMEAGAVDCGFRWQWKLWGAHVSARNMGHNFRGIGICLIGNYHRNPVPHVQYQSLVRTVRTLMVRYHIPPSRVVPHGRLTGEQTVCPGKFFPYERLMVDISV